MKRVTDIPRNLSLASFGAFTSNVSTLMAIVAALTSFNFFQNHSFGTSNSFWRSTNNKVFLHCISRSRSIDFTMCSCEGINILYSFSTFSYDQAAFIGRNGDIFCVFCSIFISSSKRSGTEDNNCNGGI